MTKMLLSAFHRWLKTELKALNVFENEETRIDPFRLRTALLSTRIYLIVLTFSVLVLALSKSLIIHHRTVTIENPSQSIFEDLINHYSTGLICPCSHIALRSDSFVTISPYYHTVCSSFLVTDLWINHLFTPNITDFF